MYERVCSCMCTCAYCLKKPEGGSQAPGARVTGTCELSNMSAGNQAPALCKGSMWSNYWAISPVEYILNKNRTENNYLGISKTLHTQMLTFTLKRFLQAWLSNGQKKTKMATSVPTRHALFLPCAWAVTLLQLRRQAQTQKGPAGWVGLRLKVSNTGDYLFCCHCPCAPATACVINHGTCWKGGAPGAVGSGVCIMAWSPPHFSHSLQSIPRMLSYTLKDNLLSHRKICILKVFIMSNM